MTRPRAETARLNDIRSRAANAQLSGFSVDHADVQWLIKRIDEFEAGERQRAIFDSLLLPAHLEQMLVKLREWTLTHGAALCPGPGRADTYGDGMRDAKSQVGKILRAWPGWPNGARAKPKKGP